MKQRISCNCFQNSRKKQASGNEYCDTLSAGRMAGKIDRCRKVHNFDEGEQRCFISFSSGQQTQIFNKKLELLKIIFMVIKKDLKDLIFKNYCRYHITISSKS